MTSTTTIAEGIKRILKVMSVNSSNELVYAYWVLIDGIKEVKDARKATPAESITRVHREMVRLEEIPVPLWSKKRNKKQVFPIDEFASIK